MNTFIEDKQPTYVVSKIAYPTVSQAVRVVQKVFPDMEIKRYKYESAYDIHGILLDHANYHYFRLVQST